MRERIVANPDNLKYASKLAENTGKEVSDKFRKCLEAAENHPQEDSNRFWEGLYEIVNEHTPNISEKQMSEMAAMLNEFPTQKDEVSKQR